MKGSLSGDGGDTYLLITLELPLLVIIALLQINNCLCNMISRTYLADGREANCSPCTVSSLTARRLLQDIRDGAKLPEVEKFDVLMSLVDNHKTILH